MTDTLWTDLILGVHLGYAGFVTFGFVAVLIGWPMNWRWTRSSWFRLTHMAAIAIVAYLASLSLACPLTVLEYKLRGFTGDPVEEHFLGRLLSGLSNYECPNWVFTTGYLALTALAIALLWIVPMQGNLLPKPKLLARFAGSNLGTRPGRERR